VEDAIGSVANYFAEHKWRRDQPVTLPVEVSGEDWKSLLSSNLKPEHTVADLKQAGVKVPADLPADASARLQHLQGKAGDEYWLTLHNFFVITRYNLSHLYAMAVFQLAERIRQP
jgi:membrane-bound lytic murein transglycosylase B